MPAVMSPDSEVKGFYPVGTPFLVSHSLEQKESNVLRQPLQRVVQRGSCCVLSSHRHGEVLPDSMVTRLTAPQPDLVQSHFPLQAPLKASSPP